MNRAEKEYLVSRLFSRFRGVRARMEPKAMVLERIEGIRRRQEPLADYVIWSTVWCELLDMERLRPKPRGKILALASRCRWIELLRAKDAVRMIGMLIDKPFSRRSYFHYLYGDPRRPRWISALDLWAVFAKKHEELYQLGEKEVSK